MQRGLSDGDKEGGSGRSGPNATMVAFLSCESTSDSKVLMVSYQLGGSQIIDLRTW